MEFETGIGLSRKDIRKIALAFRKLYKIKTIRFPVLYILEKLTFDFDDVFTYVIEEDCEFDANVPAYLETNNEYTEFCCHISKYVYVGALENRGDCLGFIVHELSHFILLYMCEIRPNNTFNMELQTKNIPPYKNTEWQAKALCGELMIPYDMCKNKTYKQIKYITKSSKSQIDYFFSKILKD